MYDRGFDGVQHTYVIVADNKVSNKIIAVVCHRFKTNDNAVVRAGKFNKTRLKQLELSPSYVYLNGFMSSFPSEDMTDAK